MTTPIPSTRADLTATLRLIESWLARTQQRADLPSLSVGAILPDGTRWTYAVGYADREAGAHTSPDHRYRIGSITKSFIALALLQLQREGRLRLDDPLEHYLRWFRLRYKDAPPPTLRHVLTHTAGLPRDATAPHWTEDQFQDWETVVATTTGRHLLAPPSVRFDYSNLGFALLGAVIEAVSDTAWTAYVRRHILAPLQMTATQAQTTADDPLLVKGYFAQEGCQRRRAPMIPMRGFSAAGDLCATSGDMLHYLEAHLADQDTALIDALSLREMHRPQWVQPDWSGGYGLGMEVYRIDSQTFTGHGGSYKGYLAQMLLSRERKTGVIVLANSMDADAFNIACIIMKALDQPAQTIPHSEPPAGLPGYLGLYGNDWGETAVIWRAGCLQVISLSRITQVTELAAVPEQPHTFRARSAGDFGEVWRFELDNTGRAIRLWTGHDYSTRLRDI